MAMTAPPRNTGNRTPSAYPAGVPLPTRERRPGYIALAVVLIVGLAAVGAWLYTNAGKKTPVLVATQRIEVGQTIERSDLSTVAVAGAIHGFTADQLGTVVGKTAAVTVVPNTILLGEMIRTGQSIPDGFVEVGVALKSGQLPADGLLPGDRVAVYALPGQDSAQSSASGSAQGSASTLASKASVTAARADPAQTGGTLLTLSVPTSQAGDIAVAAAAGRISVVRVGAP